MNLKFIKIAIIGIIPSLFSSCNNNPISYKSFSTDSWETILSAASQGLDFLKKVYSSDIKVEGKEDSFVIYDMNNEDEVKRKTRTINIDNFGEYTVRVVGENVDKLSADTSKTAALTFELCNILYLDLFTNDQQQYNNYEFSTIRHKLNNSIFDKFPSGLKNGIKIVEKETPSGNDGTLYKTNEKVFLLSLSEYEGDNPYQYYKNNEDNPNCYHKYYSDTVYSYFTRSPSVEDSTCVHSYFAFHGDFYPLHSFVANGISFAFAI